MTDTHDVVAAQAPGAPAPADLSGLKVAELQALAARLGIPGAGRLRKAELLDAVRQRTSGGPRPATTPAPSAEAPAAPAASEAPAADGTVPAARAASPEPAALAPSGDAPATRPTRTRRRVATAPAGAPAAAAEQPPTDPTGPGRPDDARAEQPRPDDARAEQPRPDDARAEQPRTEHPRTEHPRTEQPRTEQPDLPPRTAPSDEPAPRGRGEEPVRARRQRPERDGEEQDGAGRAPSRARRRAQRDAAAAVEEAVLKAEPILPDLPYRGERPAADRQRPARDRQPDRQPDREPESRREDPDRGRQPEQDRQADDRPADDRPDRPDRQGGVDRQQGYDADGYDDERGGRRRRGRNRQRDKVGRPLPGREPRGMDEPEVREDDVLVPVAGIVEILESYAFVRTSGYLPGPADVYVSLAQVKKYGLRKGDAVVGQVKQERPGGDERRGKYNAIVQVDSINGQGVDEARSRDEFGKLTPLYPQERLRLETAPNVLSTRIIDLVAPIGKGQRGLIVSPPKAGKTLVLQAIANAITTNNPECHLMVVLVDERPEEVTDMQRTVKGEVIASTFDRPAEDHTTVAELAIERAKRLVELGHDVVVLLDSITRLGRAYNLAAPASGRILSGGVDSSALYPPKRFFGAARNIEDGGSLTILATALVETGSKMDEVIFEEFKGTGNMELRLSRQLADKRIYPAVDVNPSGTRREEVLLDPDELRIMWQLRRVLTALDPQQAIELLMDRLKKSRSNTEFLLTVGKSSPAGNRDDA